MRYDQVLIRAFELRVAQWIDAQGNPTQPLKLADPKPQGGAAKAAAAGPAAAVKEAKKQ